MKSGVSTKLKILGFLLLIVAVVYYFFHFDLLPERVPIHYDASGNPNGYGSRWSAALFFPIMGAVMLLLHWSGTLDPMMMNYPVTVTQENVNRLHSLSLELLAFITFWMGIFSVYFSWITIANSTSQEIPELDNYLFWGLMAALFLGIFIYLIKMMKVKQV